MREVARAFSKRACRCVNTPDDVGNTYTGVIVCSSYEGWLPSIDSVVVEVSVDPVTKKVTGSVSMDISTSTNAHCSSTIELQDEDGNLVSKTFNLGGQTSYIEDTYIDCMLPQGNQPGGTLKAEFTVLSVTGTGNNKKAQLSIAVLPCER